MKKALILLVAMLFLTVAVGAAFAADTTFNGQYRIRAFSNWNFDKRPNNLDSERGLYTGYFDQRFRLTITHKSSDFLKAVVQFDLVEDTWGQQRNFRINNSTTGSLVRKAYIEFALPKIGTFTVGKQPVTLGYGLAFSDSLGNLDGIKWANKWGPVGVSAMYFKWRDNVVLGGASEFYNRDSEIFALDLKYNPNANHAIELFGGYVKYGTGYTISHGWGLTPARAHANLGFAGIAYTGEINNMITLKGEVSGLFGREDYPGVDNAFNGGINVYLDASYHNDLLRVGLAFILGSGSNDNDWDDEVWNANYILADAFYFGNIIAGGYGSGGLNDPWVRGLGFANDVENLTAVKLYFEATPLCCDGKLTLNAAVIWAKWTEPVGATRAYDHPMNYYNPATTYASWYNGSMDLGWEIDLGVKYVIMDGLTYTFSGGVLFTGDSFDYEGDAGTHEEWGPIWMINNVLTYDF